MELQVHINNHRKIHGVTPSGHYSLECIHCEKQFYSANRNAEYCASRKCQKAKEDIEGSNSLDYNYTGNE